VLAAAELLVAVEVVGVVVEAEQQEERWGWRPPTKRGRTDWKVRPHDVVEVVAVVVETLRQR